MGEVVNLRQKRKEIERARKEGAADENRAAFGRTRTEREKSEAEKDMLSRKLDGAKRDDEPVGEPEDETSDD